jgi:peptidoglycan/xylan/chitin deacetylase (PgdA/CDA1 family)
MQEHKFSNLAILAKMVRTSLSPRSACPLCVVNQEVGGEALGGVGQALPWLPSPFMRLSCRLHALGLAAVTCVPDSLGYVGGILALNQMVIIGAGMYPRSTLLGINMVRLPLEAAARREVALTFDDGPDPTVTPKVLQVLESYGIKASFFFIGKRALAHPEIVAETTARGHRVENHSFSHSSAFGFYGANALARDIRLAQEVLEKITGRQPTLLRAPLGIRNVWLDPVLAQLGLMLVSWTRRGFDTVCREPRKITRRLLQGLTAGDILLLHDGSASCGPRGSPVILEVLPRLLDEILARGLSPVPIT